jgi:predicted O-methyltransferase YrrM
MGTEHAGNLIASLVGMIRPRTVLEIGAGDSTIAIAKAMADACAEERRDYSLVQSAQWSERAELLRPSLQQERPRSRFVSIDNCAGRGSSAEEAWSMVCELDLEGVEFVPVRADFFHLKKDSLEAYCKADLIWIDAGSVADDARFFCEVSRYLNAGGFVLMHEPYMTGSVVDGERTRLATVRNPLWEQISKRGADDVEVLSIPELHKYRQGGIGIVGKRHKWEVDRAESFEEELMELDLPPVTLESPLLGPVRPNHVKMATAPGSDTCRKVYHAIGCGKKTLGEISELCGVKGNALVRCIGMLVSAGLVASSDDGFHECPEAWRKGFSEADV